jgi:hypothetical protein
MKNKTGLIIGGGVLVVGTFLVLSYFNKKKKIELGVGSLSTTDSSDSSGSDSSGSSGSSGSTTSQPAANLNLTQNASFPLKNGSRGKQVVELQKFLNTNGYADPKLVVDGVFGSKTEAALMNMYNNPASKPLNDYIKSNLWAIGSSAINTRQVNKAFYDIFIGKTVSAPPALATTPTNPTTSTSVISNPFGNPFNFNAI